MPSELTPQNTVFVSLSFEGPDQYSQAGGLGVRVAGLTTALAAHGFETHLLFIGDPYLPAQESREEGRLTLHRWCQWISRFHPAGVYDGEEGKLSNFNDSAPWYLADRVLAPALHDGKIGVVIAEDWQTAEAICRLSDLLFGMGLRDRAVLMWNANNLFGFHRINWGRLRFTSALTTVSKYMKHRLWAYGQNPLVIPNGIPERFLEAPPVEYVDACRALYCASDAVLANSGHEPFGLVGLEVMGAGGTAVTGSTGEDYAVHFENAVVVDTDDPGEMAGYLVYLRDHPEQVARLKAGAAMTAQQFTWSEVLPNLLGKASYLAQRQGAQ